MYDTVLVNCPSCGKEHEFQSKSGECLLGEYTLQDCPSDVLRDVNRHSPYRCSCKALFEVDKEQRKPIFTKSF